MNFVHPQFLWLCLLAAIFLWATRHKSHVFGHPQLGIHKTSWWMPWPGYLARFSQAAMWCCLVVALAVPLVVNYTVETRHGAIVLLQQDLSDSEAFGAILPVELALAGPEFAARSASDLPGAYITDQFRRKDDPTFARRIDVSFGALRLFLQHTHGNPVGLMAFDNGSFLAYPPTTNYQTLIDSLPELADYMEAEVPEGHGTNFDGPFARNREPGALQSVIDVFRRLDSGVTRVHIMSTDGSAPIAPERFRELVDWYKKLHINLFVFGVGEDWYEGQAKDLQQLKDFVKAVDGTVVPVADKAGFDAAVAKIDALAESSLYQANRSEHKEMYLPWIAAAAAFFLLWATSTILVREGL